MDFKPNQEVSSTVYGGFSSDRQGIVRSSLVPLRSGIKVRPKMSVPLRSSSVQAAMGVGGGVANVAVGGGKVAGGSLPLLPTPARLLWQGFRYELRVISAKADAIYAAAVIADDRVSGKMGSDGLFREGCWYGPDLDVRDDLSTPHVGSRSSMTAETPGVIALLSTTFGASGLTKNEPKARYPD